MEKGTQSKGSRKSPCSPPGTHQAPDKHLRTCRGRLVDSTAWPPTTSLPPQAWMRQGHKQGPERPTGPWPRFQRRRGFLSLGHFWEFPVDVSTVSIVCTWRRRRSPLETLPSCLCAAVLSAQPVRGVKAGSAGLGAHQRWKPRPRAGHHDSPLWSPRVRGRLSFLSPQLKTSPEPRLFTNTQLSFRLLNFSTYH